MAENVKTLNGLAWGSLNSMNSLARASIKTFNGIDTTGGGGGGFVPTDIAGCELWLDASQIVGLSDGDPVETWPDLSGNGNDATQASVGNQPTYQTNEFGGLPGIQFSGGQVLNLLSDISGAQPWTVFTVMKRTSAGHDLVGLASTGNQPYGCYLYNNGNVYISDQTGYASIANSSTGPLVATGRASTGLELFFDGVSLAVGFNTNVDVSNFQLIGRRGLEYSIGYIAETIYYNSALGTTPRQTVEAYLMTKYGL